MAIRADRSVLCSNVKLLWASLGDVYLHWTVMTVVKYRLDDTYNSQ